MKKLIQLISLLLITTAVLSAQPRWNPVIYTNSTTLYGKVSINGVPAQLGDKVGVFVGNECRGVADVVTNLGDGYASILIQGDVTEEASFRIWKQNDDVVYKVFNTVLTSPGGTIGTPPDYFLIEGTGPGWKPVIYTNSTTLYGIVTINNLSAQPGDVVGAFVNGECRGREEVIMNNDTAFVTMLIQGESVENVSFQIWQSSSKKELLVPKLISSDPGGTISFININAVNGLVAFFPFNNNLIDETKNGFDISGSGLKFIQDRFNVPNTSVAFDGTTSQAELANSTSLNFPQNGFTISTWVKFANNTNAVIFGKHVHGYYNGYFLAAVNNQLQFYVSGIPITTSETFNDNAWHLVTGVYDGVNATLFVDGVQKITQRIAYTAFSPNPVRLAYMQTPGYPERYNGLIDDARIYNVPLTQADVSSLFSENHWTAQIINVLNPNGEIRIKANSVYRIDWTATQYIDSVKIEFTPDDGRTWEVIAPSLPGNSGSFNWKAPILSTMLGKIRISHLTSGVSAISSVPFYIDLPQVEITSPVGGELWQVGSTQTITWNTSYFYHTNIDYSTDGGVKWNSIALYIPTGMGSYDWVVPNDTTRKALVRISDADDSTFFDVSDSAFTIFQPKLTLTNPVGGERYRLGTTQNISWTNEFVAKVRIEFSQDNGLNWAVLPGADSVLASLSTFNWTPNVETKQAKIRVSDFMNSALQSTSNAFEIFIPKISLTSPNGGEQWRTGTSQKINWTSNDVAKVKIQYTTNDGTNWIVVADSALASIGSFDWIIPSPVTNQAKVRITDYKDVTVSAQSAAPFTIYFPSVTLTSPNGGELWQIGSQKNISWTSTYLTKVKLEYTTNGTTWKPIADQLDANLNNYLWTIPNDPSVNAKVRVSDATDNLVSYASELPFTIYQQKLTLTSPLGGERYRELTEQTVTWTSEYVDTIKIELSEDNGVTWAVINGAVPAKLGSWPYIASTWITKQAKIRISDSKNPALQSTSNVFEFFRPTITISFPNGGEQWRVGTTQKILWTSSDVANVKIEYTIDNIMWNTIASSVTSTVGSYDWVIPNSPSVNCKVKISDASDNLYSDLSDNVFSIILPQITVLKPNSGENFVVGKTDTIKWSSANVANVKLEYTTNNGTNWSSILASTPAAAGSFVWTIPNTPSTNCKVRISDVANSLFADTSDNVFSIILPKLTLLKPNGGEIFPIAKTDTIKWTSSNIANVKLEFTINNGNSWIPITNSTPAATGSYLWSVPNYASINCKVRISDVTNSLVADTSNNPFTIILPTLTLLKPNGGENFIVGKTDTIKWSSTYVDNVEIKYTTDNNIWNTIIASTPASSGSFLWAIPNTPSTTCQIWISDVAKVATSHISANYFSIVLPKITVLKPNGGENFIVGKTDTIKWSSSNVANVKLEYTTDSGSNWISILASTPAAVGSFVWTIPNTLSANCLVRVSDVANVSVPDISDNVFSIILPKITVLKPNGGENFFVGKTDSIKWTSSNVANVKLEYTTDSGSNWISILASTPASAGSYLWTIQNTPSSNCKVKVSDVFNPEINDLSDGTFFILAPTIRLTSPNGDEQWQGGTEHTISWTQKDVSRLIIDYTLDDNSWIPIPDTLDATVGSYKWLVPNTASTKARVRLTETTDTLVRDVSDKVFTIFIPKLTVTKPNGGETFVAGRTDTIKWTSGNIENIKLEFSADNGLNWNAIIALTPASGGNYVWTIPSTSSKNCKVRISDVLNPEMTDMSDGVFTIIIPTITLTSPNGGEKWLAQTNHQISWTSSDLDSVRIDFSFDNGTTWNVIAPKVFAWDAIYNWNVESPPSSQALIRVSKYNDLSVQDVSDNVFTIYKEALAVTSPNGGEKLRAKTIVPITWNISEIVNPKTRKKNLGDERSAAFAPIQNIKIEFTSDNGLNWSTLAASVNAELKSYNWEIPAIESKNCLVRITDLNDAAHSDTSDNVFEIYSPKVIVTSPNGGEKWRTSTTQKISWISNEINKVKIEYSTNDGFAWKIISDSVNASAETIDWKIPAERTSRARVRITDVSLASTSDTSDNTFTIVVPEITLTSPAGGENWKTNTVQQIRWNSLDVELVSIEFSSDNGTSWLPIKDSVLASSGLYNWTIPRTPTEQAKIRVSDVNYKEISAVSNVFSIIKPLALLVPQGGEKWFSGSTQQIKWNFNFVDSVKLEYSLNNGASWQLIANSLSATLLTYNWNIPQNISSTRCRVKISDRNNILTADSSLEVFTIMTPTLTVLTPNGGENLKGGTEFQLTWKNQNSDSLVIDYTIDNGTTWANIIKSTNAKTEKLTWTVPKVTSTQCLIRVIDKYYTTVADTSDKVFSIYTPEIILVSPKGGETWYVGETKQIKWKSSFVDSVKIELTTNNGSSWRALANSFAAADSMYALFIDKTPSATCRVKISAVEDPTIIDSSRSNFAIAILPPTIRVSILQNPVLTQYCNVVLVSDSLLSALPITKVWRNKDTVTYEMQPIQNSTNVFECSVKFDTTAIYNFQSRVISKMGIEKDTLRQFAVGVALPNLFAKVTSRNEGLSLAINPGVVEEKTFFSIEEEKMNKEIIYNLQPAKTFKKAIGVELSFANETFEEVYKFSVFVLENGEWKPVPSKVNKKEKTVTASITTLGKVKLGIDVNKKEELDLPQTFALIQNYPNPFNPSTVIAYHLPEDCEITLEIYNMLGARITTLRSGFAVAGRYSITWNGMNDANVQVPSGIYLYRLKTSKFDQVRKMILLK